MFPDPVPVNTTLPSLKSKLAKIFWGVTDEGNFGDSNILSVPVSLESFVAESGRVPADLLGDISRVRQTLLEERSKRVPPGIDDKVLTSWNAMMLKAFAEAGAVFQDDRWIAVAEKNARLLLEHVKDSEGRLLHTWKATSNSPEGALGEARILGYLDDHACLVDSLLTLYEATFDYSYVDRAQDLAGQMIVRFWDTDW